MIMRRLVCLLAGHRRIRTITGVRWASATPFGDVRGEITDQRFDCVRCGKEDLDA